ncbi:nuclear inhibitor of protein phosphatase 1-like [Littorina saxatilis]|uniref:Nuclear inhibitor of protein phosphatase 1 n=1 Tax=Littorina saxatilis TaxID=31220 RepID=A0AAN9GBG9_9CAEN
MAGPLVNNFEVPSWAGKPPPGLHLDVMKDTKMVQKLMIDEKKCYFFGRNKQLCDFSIDHSSCSRVHSALVWHRHLNRPFIIDLGSTHGTHIGNIRLESKKPQQVPLDSEIHFGASTRIYIIRERPQPLGPGGLDDDGNKQGEKEGNLLGLPESETELDNLTEFNTAHNRRIASVAELVDVPNPLKRKSKSTRVTYAEEEEIINPEDIDPSIGRFRNLVSTTVIPTKRAKLDGGLTSGLEGDHKQHTTSTTHFGDLPGHSMGSSLAHPLSFAAKLGIPIPNLAPDVEHEPAPPPLPPSAAPFVPEDGQKEPRKKKYAKEAWPGKKPTHNLLV